METLLAEDDVFASTGDVICAPPVRRLLKTG